MKVLVISDTHGHIDNLYPVLEREAPVDALIHCGDVEGDENAIREAAGCPCAFVKGNNDYFSDLPMEIVADLNGCRIMAAHGHSYGVSSSVIRLAREAREKGASVVLYGHTHAPHQEQTCGVWALNPGSLTYPRQMGRQYTYLILEIEEGGKVKILPRNL